MHKISALQINNSFSGHYYLPYSIGLLNAYYMAHSKLKNFRMIDMFYKRGDINDIVQRLLFNDVVLFSTYVWNINVSLEIAKRLKHINKEVVIIFGGPSVPDKASSFLKRNKFIDIACHQEGERKLTNILDGLHNNEWENTPGISFFDREKFIINNDVPRIKDLSVLPSPYLSGIFNNLMEENENDKWLASWETNRGCPFACTYCDWGSAINSKVSKIEIEKLYKELEWFAKRKIEFIFVCDANFGMLPRDYDISKRAVELKKNYGYPHVLSVQATKNARERSYKIQKLLYDGGLHKSVNIAMQTTDRNTLVNIKRDNISLSDYNELQRRFIKDGIPTYSDLIIGLPGDNYSKFKESVDHLFDCGQHYRIQFNNLSILPNAEMADPEYMEKFKIDVVKIPVVSMHGSIDREYYDDVDEEQELVVSHKDMDCEEWIKIRSFASAVEFYYYNKMLQIPLMLLCNLCKIPLSTAIEHLLNQQNYGTLKKLNRIFHNHTKRMLKGDYEFIKSKKWLNIFWPPGEYAMIKLFEWKKVDLFYDEAQKLLEEMVDDKIVLSVLEDAINYNKFLLRKPKAYREDEFILLNYNIPSMINEIKLKGTIESLDRKIRIKMTRKNADSYSYNEWAQQVIWYGHRSSSYFYGDSTIRKEIAGHY